MKLAAVIGAAVFALIPSAGLADTITITFYSDPAGATLYANASEQMFGHTPVTLKYKHFPKGFLRSRDCTTIESVRVRWASGAEASAPALRVCAEQGKKQHFTFARPRGVPGNEIDAMFAMELQRIAALREEARADRRAAAWQAYWAASQENLRRQRMLTCSSHFIGSTLYTNCQ